LGFVVYWYSFKFDTVTTGEFRDHFVTFFETLATADAEMVAAENDATPASKKKKNNKNKGGNKQRETTSSSPMKETASMVAAKAIKALDWDRLFFSTGMPVDVVSFSNSLSVAAEDLAQKWIAHSATYKYSKPPAGITGDEIKNWPTQQRNVFLETLQNFSKKSLSSPAEVFPVEFLVLLDNTYKFTESKNAEIMLRWQTLCLESEASWILPHVEEFITSQGRMKYVRPLYRLLRNSAMGKELAISTFEKNKDM
jgi:hypothetical protein